MGNERRIVGSSGLFRRGLNFLSFMSIWKVMLLGNVVVDVLFTRGLIGDETFNGKRK